MKIPLSVQLYTVRDLTEVDFAGTVREIAKIGYKNVELARYGNLSSANEVRKALDDVGLTVASAHARVDLLEGDVNKVLDDQDILGNRLLVVPWVAEERRNSADAWRKFADVLNGIGEKTAKRNIQLAYHNHSFEFQKYDGVSGMDILAGNLNPKLVKLELDVYWLKHGGVDPVAYIDKNADRTILLHLKDMAPGEEQRFAEVGEGTIDFKAIAAAGQRAGVKSYIVEQDDCYGKSPLECVKRSLENLKKMGLA